MSLLEVKKLSVNFKNDKGLVRAVRNVSFSIEPGEIVALVGESGSGKSTIGLTLMRLIEKTKQLEMEGKIFFQNKIGESFNLMSLTDRQMRKIRGKEIAMIFQEPMSSLNPIFTIGTQIIEAICTHNFLSKSQAHSRAIEMLSLLSIPDPVKCLTNYPHQISGGMRQRVMIAMALSCDPALLIADEPTTALDVTIQAQIVDILRNLQRKLGMSILFITHDLGLVSEIADRVLVLYGGQVVEIGKVRKLFESAYMPYTKALLRSIPVLGSSKLPDYRVEPISGSVPNPASLPVGCGFHPRCHFFESNLCDVSEPTLEDIQEGHHVRCFRWREIREGEVS